eukprot:CAMPEP_0178426798 /NCGR_PEP_ID=MMETSP0689_2-20121128/29417_1 /TAXON_ID=160604 /ORGANISM="Amphidinium massartii, Strain CS-259" /LENGTH=241 /DNA_ID=CAMNT_0020048489 /DNA_START=44 /DNA_END=766 /DNA_ORIENTATION=-
MAVPPLHIYHVSKFRSTRVVWLLAELADCYPSSPLPKVVVHEFSDVKSFRNEKPDWFLQLNPNGKIPVLVQNSRVLIEGGAIMLSLLDKYDPDKKLLRDVDRDLFYQLAFYCAGTVDNLTSTSSPYQRAVLMHGQEDANMAPTIDPVRKTAWFDIAGPFLESLLAQSTGTYFGGETFSAVDIFVGMDLFAYHERMITRGDGKSWIDPTSMPRLHALATTLATRPARNFAFSATLNEPASLE